MGEVVAGVGGGVVNAGARGEEVRDRRLLLLLGEPADVVDPELGQGPVQVDHAALDVDPVEHGEDALPDGGDVADGLDVAVLEEDASADDGHHPRGREGGEPFADPLEPLARPADVLGPFDAFPLGAGEDGRGEGRGGGRGRRWRDGRAARGGRRAGGEGEREGDGGGQGDATSDGRREVRAPRAERGRTGEGARRVKEACPGEEA